VPLKPLPFREVKRKLEAAGFEKVSQKVMLSLLKLQTKELVQILCLISGK
jgi:hypothetical protein